MADMREFKRMHYFTGLFMTAEDFAAEQEYHREKLRLHNRGLHTPGVLPGVADGLAVRAGGGLNLEVRPGAAIDAAGNEILLGEPRTLTVDPARFTLPRLVYVTLRYAEEETDPVRNVQEPAYSGNTRTTERAFLEVGDALPDNRAVLELARIDLQPGVADLADPADPESPGGNAIDRRRVPVAGAVCVPDPAAWLPDELRERVVQLMGRTRRDFAALGLRFPVPSAGDARQAALTLEMLARIGYLRAAQLAGLVTALAEIEQDAGQELAIAYPPLAKLQLYQEYVDAVEALLAALREGDPAGFLTCQDQVAEAARELAEAVLELPVAAAGADRTVTAAGDEVAFTLDAGGSQAYGGRTIARYRWELRSSSGLPQAFSGSSSHEVTVTGDEGKVTLDASGSTPSSGATITRYRWDRK